MISLRSPLDQPPVLLYMATLTASVACAATGISHPALQGLLLMAWGTLALIRILWLTEIVHYNQTQPHPSRSRLLPWILLSNMESQARTENAFRSLRALNPIMTLWGLAACACLLWALFSAFFPDTPEMLAQLNHAIADYWHQSAAQPALLEQNLVFMHNLLIALTPMLTIAPVFWLGQSYAYNAENGDLALWYALALAGIALITAIGPDYGSALTPESLLYRWRGAGVGAHDILPALGLLDTARPLTSFAARVAQYGIAGTILLYALVLLTALVIARGLLRGRQEKLYALAGLTVIAVMLAADLCLPLSPQLYGFWLSCWALLSVLWVRAGTGAPKRYKMYQA